MQLHQMRYVLTLAKCGGFSQAAKELFVAQPTLSQQIMALEEELGIKLFVRQPRRATLTDAGEEFVRYARRIVNETDGLAQAMASYAAEARGRVRIGVLWVFGYLGIAESLHGFNKENPAIETPITVNGSMVLLQKLQSRELDAVYVIATENDLRANPEVGFRKILGSDMMLIIPVDHPIARKESISYSDLDGQNVIIPARDSNMYPPVMNNFHTCGAVPNVVCESSQSDVIIQCASGGLGCAFISESIARAMVNDKIVIRPIHPIVRREVYFAVLRETLVIPGVRSLWDYMGRSCPEI